jgi:hypothetical protein
MISRRPRTPGRSRQHEDVGADLWGCPPLMIFAGVGASGASGASVGGLRRGTGTAPSPKGRHVQAERALTSSTGPRARPAVNRAMWPCDLGLQFFCRV